MLPVVFNSVLLHIISGHNPGYDSYVPHLRDVRSQIKTSYGSLDTIELGNDVNQSTRNSSNTGLGMVIMRSLLHCQ